MRNRHWRDILGAILLFSGCIALGLGTDLTLEKPLPFTYISPVGRLENETKTMNRPVALAPISITTVTKKELSRISADRSALILDARPRIFFKLGHIPNALSLPRDDFKMSYQKLQETLSSYRDKSIVVYCSDIDCPDSRMVAEALQRLGYSHVRLFLGGWDEWVDSHLATQQGCHCGDE